MWSTEHPARLAAAPLVLACVLASAAALPAWAQSVAWGEQRFLNREGYPWWGQRYENYSLLSYRDYEYGTTRDENPTFDAFGTYLLDGIDLLNVSESRSLVRQVRGSSASWSDAGRFRNLVILRDQYRNWSTRLMVGDLLDAHFTPLTLAKPRLPGLRWDGSSHKNSFTVVASRASSPTLNSGAQFFSTYLYAARWESQLGDMVRFGVSYLNLFHGDAMQRHGSLRGDLPQVWIPSRAFYLMVSDDSPGDGTGVQVFDVELHAGGQRLDLEPEVRRVPSLARVEDVPHLRRDGAWAPRSMQPERLLTPGIGLLDRTGEPVAVAGAAPLDVGGTDLLVFRYDLPADVEPRALRLRALVAGDYSLDVGTTATWEGLGSRVLADWHNAARAPGNAADGANLRWVEMACDLPVGLSLFSSDVSADLLGFHVQGEYANSFGSYLFPLPAGRRRSAHERAWFAKVLKELGSWRLGGEAFDLPSDYDTSLPFWSETSQKTLSYEVVEDNDDRDEWADTWEQWDPLEPGYLSRVDQQGFDVETETPTGAQDHLGLGPRSGPVGYGVFPGLDKEGDGLIDINVNRNGTPDYREPFLMYYVEPDDFVYGDDLNNNGVADERENDNTPNYPYDLDSRGLHLFASVAPAEGLRLQLGRYRVRQPAAGGRSDVSYAQVEYAPRAQEVGQLALHYRLKRVRDDIADPVYEAVVNALSTGALSMRIRPDLLLQRNSVVSTLFVEDHYEGLERLHLVNATKVEVNSLLAHGNEGRGRIVHWTLLSKGEYAWPLGALTVTPMAKFLLQRRAGPGRLLADLHTWELFPVLRADYPLTERTILRAGMQGLPLFAHRFRDVRSPSQSFDARHYVLSLQTASNYVGYDVSVNIGFRSSRLRLLALPGDPRQQVREVFVQTRVL